MLPANLLSAEGRVKSMIVWVGFLLLLSGLAIDSITGIHSFLNLMSFFSPNIGAVGRLVRGVCGLGCGGAAWFFHENTFVAVTLAGSGVFMLFEALKGWCVARACGLKTPL